MDATDLAASLHREQFPRSNAYDPVWVVDNMMGPHPLWLMEHLTDLAPPATGSRVMDLGCGKAMTSVFLAREFDVKVHAVDLWIEDNRGRIADAGETERIETIHADAAGPLPFPDEHFDAILSVDAYHYFGRDPAYLGHILGYVAPGGTLGIVVPSVRHEVEAWPEALEPFVEAGFETFHSVEWWRGLWEQSGLVTVEHSAPMPDGYELWLDWSRTWDRWTGARRGTPFETEVAMLEADVGRLFGFACIVATKS